MNRIARVLRVLGANEDIWGYDIIGDEMGE